MSNTFEKMQAAGLAETEETATEVLEIDTEVPEANLEDDAPDENTNDTETSLAADEEFDGFELEEDEKAPSEEDKKQHAWKRIKSKAKAAKQDAKDSNKRAKMAESEADQLRKQIAILAQGQMKKPDMLDYDSQDDFLRAMNKYAQVQRIAQPQQVTNQQVQDQYPTAQPEYDDSQYKEARDAHHARAQKSGVDAEKFVDGELKLREKHGDMVVDQMIDVLGEGSEQVIYVLGNNEAAFNKFNAVLESDPGAKSVAHLIDLKHRIKPKKRTKSAAPEPDRAARGSSVSVSALQKQFDKADKAGDTGEMFRLRRQARKDGVKLH